MTATSDSILLFEYFTASGEKDKGIISEAEAMLFGLIDDLKDYRLDVVLNESYKNIISQYDNVNPILIDGDVISWLKDNASKFNKAIFIAGENNNNLYNITRILEENNVYIYTSASNACRIACDKFLTYKELQGVVPQPKSFKLEIDSKCNLKNRVPDELSNKKLIIKPLIGVDCEGIIVTDDINDLEEISLQDSTVIVQEFIEGEDVSVSLLCGENEIIPISLNKQFIDICKDKGKYIGGKLPFESKYKNEIFDIAIRACKKVKGLKGFVGVDLLITENHQIYLLEINSRFTTPYVGLKKIANINIAKTIIEENISDLDISLDGEVEFRKSGNDLEVRRI